MARSLQDHTLLLERREAGLGRVTSPPTALTCASLRARCNSPMRCEGRSCSRLPRAPRDIVHSEAGVFTDAHRGCDDASERACESSLGIASISFGHKRKSLIRYDRSGTPFVSSAPELAMQVPASEFVLESSGNARTLCNPNASCFSQYTELQFSDRSPRVAGATPEVALKTVGLSKGHVPRTCQLVATILHLGNLEFTIDRSGAAANKIRSSPCSGPSSPYAPSTQWKNMPKRSGPLFSAGRSPRTTTP
ncbi:hypothetical protein B0H17DRAFT_1192694 [Mycena rosella]|uniref:Uncharacterized protein n=1 Tax=Mycena rosella TaxID=1033263 RepID=A0AAD7M8S7_MYCRO|nr:hypothetical protein B0H17DRAFT_1192694 [Mycena rosella]